MKKLKPSNTKEEGIKNKDRKRNVAYLNFRSSLESIAVMQESGYKREIETGERLFCVWNFAGCKRHGEGTH